MGWELATHTDLWKGLGKLGIRRAASHCFFSYLKEAGTQASQAGLNMQLKMALNF